MLKCPSTLVYDEQRRLLIIEDDLTQTVRGKSFLHRNRLVGKEVEMVEALVSGCGKEVVNGMLHYWVRWAEILEPEDSLGDAKEMVWRMQKRDCKISCLRRSFAAELALCSEGCKKCNCKLALARSAMTAKIVAWLRDAKRDGRTGSLLKTRRQQN